MRRLRRVQFFAGAALTRAVLGRGLGGKYDPNQRRDDDGRWTDGTPGPDVDLDDDDDSSERGSADLSPAYTETYGQVLDEEGVTRDGATTLAAVVTDKRSLHVATGDQDRKVLTELTPAQARELAESIGNATDSGTPATDETTGVEIVPSGSGYHLTWPNGTTVTLDDSDETSEVGEFAEALRSMADTHEDRFGAGAKSLAGKPERAKLPPKVDKLRLGPRIDLADGEELRASRKLTTSMYAETEALGAAVSTPAGPEVWVGIVLHGDEQKWDAEQDGGTLRIGRAGLDAFAAAVDAETKSAKERSAWLRKQWAEHERLDDARADGTIDDAGRRRLAELEAWNQSYEVDDMLSEGVVPGGAWGDLAYQVWGEDDAEGGWKYKLTVRPPDSGGGWSFPETWDENDDPSRVAELSAADMRKFLKQLGELAAAASPVPAASNSVRRRPRPVRRVTGRAYTRDNRGRFAETPGGGILDADAYHDFYGDFHDEVNLADGLTVRAFESGNAHVVFDHVEDGATFHEVAVEFDDADGMREFAEALDWAADADVPEGDFSDWVDAGNGFAVGPDATGDISVRALDADGTVGDAVLDVSPDTAVALADAVREMADSLDDLLTDDAGPAVGRGPVRGNARVLPGAIRRCPVVYARTYTRDRLGRFARVPGLDADTYRSDYGDAVNEYEVDDTDLTVRVFGDGTAHIVAEYDDGGKQMFDVLFDWDTSAEMRSAAAALEWAAQFPVPDGEAGIVATRGFGDGWVVGVEGDGLVCIIQDRSTGPEFEIGVTRARMDEEAAYDLASGIYDMANEVDDILAEDDSQDYDDDDDEDDMPVASAHAKATRAARVRGSRPVRTTTMRRSQRPAAARAAANRPATGGRREPWFRIENTGGSTADVYIYSEIGCWGLTADAFVRELAALKVTSIDLHINSPGGDVFEGVAIYNALKQHKATIHVFVDGYAASIASVIAMAGDTITMGRGTQMMIHEGNGGAVGDARDLRAYADLLDRCSDTIAGFYADRAGGDPKTWRERMLAETWYSASEAVAAGLADQVSADVAENRGPANVWDLSIFNYAGRDRAPAPGLDRPVRAVASGREPRQRRAAPVPAAPLDFTGFAEIFPAAVQAAGTLPFDPDYFRSAMQAVAADAPAPPAPIPVPPEPEPAPDEPSPVVEEEPELFDTDYFRTVMRNVAESAPAPPEPTLVPVQPEPVPHSFDRAAFERSLREARL